jgi:TRAP-type mannitol/chloroaromatic compound transport system permease small subunit
MFLITADVLSRYIFGIPVKGSYELSEMMFLSVVFLGLGYTQLYNGHVRVEFLVIGFHQRTQKILNTIMLLFALSIYTLLVWKGAEGFLESYESGEYRWGLIQIPLWPVKLMIPLGSSLLCLRFVDEIVSNVINICRRN